ncbi:MAG: tRNA 2-selenouridine(34) synthase MnmH [Bacillota bacterium]
MELITYQESLTKDSVVYIDVRTEKEYEEATIPGAVNVPVFNHQERAKIGTVYTQESPYQARLLGMDLISPKLPRLTREIKAISQDYKYVILFCARGGLRSQSLGVISELLGMKLYKLEGGYKAYRNFILDQLAEYDLDSKLLVIHGHTGVGKTELLTRLEQKGIPTIDLEGLANHRGSAFGSIGLGEPTNQKYFDSLLWERLEELNGSKLIAIEAESKRIGMSVLPDFMVAAMQNGIQILVESSVECRVIRIYEEYATDYTKSPDEFISRWLESLAAIKKYLVRKIGKESYQELVNLSKSGELKRVIRTLLTEYYDPMYNHSLKQHDDFVLQINSDDMSEITEQVISYIADY